jgi:hypothetical protein
MNRCGGKPGKPRRIRINPEMRMDETSGERGFVVSYWVHVVYSWRFWEDGDSVMIAAETVEQALDLWRTMIGGSITACPESIQFLGQCHCAVSDDVTPQEGKK